MDPQLNLKLSTKSAAGYSHEDRLIIEVCLTHKHEMWHPIRGSTETLVLYSTESDPPSSPFSLTIPVNLLPFPDSCKTYIFRSLSCLNLCRRTQDYWASLVSLFLLQVGAFNRRDIIVTVELELVHVEEMYEIVPVQLGRAGKGASLATVERLKREGFVARGGDVVGECAICLEDLCGGKSVLKMPCFHVFHENCVVSWLKEKSSCPVCRCEIHDID